MIPSFAIDIVRSIPDDATFWQPTPSDINEDGFGYFHDVWPIVTPPASEAARLLGFERAALDYLNGTCRDASDFEQQAEWIEGADDDELAALPVGMQEVFADLNGLDLGVAGLVFALAHVGFYPAASCRAHASRSWAPSPTVLFAAGEERLRALLPLIVTAGVGLQYDKTRGVPLFAVYAQSVVEMVGLGALIFGHRGALRRIPKTARRRRHDRRNRARKQAELTLF